MKYPFTSLENINFINLPRGRRLVSVPGALLNGQSLMAGYHPVVDATSVELPYSHPDLSLILVLPGKPKEFVIGGLKKLEEKLSAENLVGLTRNLSHLPVDIKVPTFHHTATMDLDKVGIVIFFSKFLENVGQVIPLIPEFLLRGVM